MENIYQVELENRMKNLMWAVSGDYSLDIQPDVASFKKSKYIAVYDAVKQGAFARYFNKDEFGLYLLKKVYRGADESTLVSIAQLCIESAVWRRSGAERPGIFDLRRKAFEDLLEFDFGVMGATLLGRVKLLLLRSYLSGELSGEKRLLQIARRITALEQADTTMAIIRTIDQIYNSEIDKHFEQEHGTLEEILAVSTQQLQDFDWQDYLNEEAAEQNLERMLEQMTESSFSMLEEEDKEQKGGGGAVYLSEEAVKKMASYIELNYGRTYLSEAEQKRLNYKICQGTHGDCSLHFTEGILNGMVKVNAQSEYARKTKENNLRAYRQNRRVTQSNIRILADVLKKSLVLRSQQESCLSEYGELLPARLWNVGRTSNTKLFEKNTKRDESDFVVDVLIDGSGSQRCRQSEVALQAYIISEALSKAGIPHRVMAFCTFWDFTVMRRFREYDEGREANDRIFEFYGSSNNRDGLAIRAAAAGLRERTEEHKILIVLSDGKPNDIIVNRPNSKNPAPYFGEYAIRDTAAEVRKLRNEGIAVLGVFVGEEQDLQAERKIFGKDFAYIRSIDNFSNVVARYLKKQLLED